MQKRGAQSKHGAGRWELAGGKVERGESSQAALARELGEEWGPKGALLPILGIAEILHHCYPPPGPEVHLLVFHVDGRSLASGAWSEQLTPMPGVELGAFDLGALPLEQCLQADRGFLGALRPYEGFGGGAS